MKILLFPAIAASIAMLHNLIADAARCYCSECTFGFCESHWCLVGFKDTRSHVAQACGNSQAEILTECGRDTGGWQELCACKDDRCNTYRYFRTKMNQLLSDQPENLKQNFDKAFTNAGGPHLDIVGKELVGYKNANLIILLVCVPLGIGTLAVVFVFINYHCKLG